MLDCGRVKARKTFVVLVAALAMLNSLGAVALALGEADCMAACCHPARQQRPRVTLSKNCCYSLCEEPAETQSATPGNTITSQRESKEVCAVAANSPAQLPARYSSARRQPGRAFIPSIRIYLRTSTLLI